MRVLTTICWALELVARGNVIALQQVSHQDPWPLPDRRCGYQSDLAGAAKHHGKLGLSGA